VRANIAIYSNSELSYCTAAVSQYRDDTGAAAGCVIDRAETAPAAAAAGASTRRQRSPLTATWCCTRSLTGRRSAMHRPVCRNCVPPSGSTPSYWSPTSPTLSVTGSSQPQVRPRLRNFPVHGPELTTRSCNELTHFRFIYGAIFGPFAVRRKPNCQCFRLRPNLRPQKSSQYVEILGQRRMKTSRSYAMNLSSGCNTAVIRELAQSGEQWQSPVRTTLMLSRLQWVVGQAQWSDLRGDDTFGFNFQLQRLQVAV